MLSTHHRHGSAKRMSAAAAAVAASLMLAACSAPAAPQELSAAPETPVVEVPTECATTVVMVTVSNLVTNGATQMREDNTAYLSTQTKNFCRRDGRRVSDTDVNTGAALTAVCQVTGDRASNGQDADASDDNNPGLHESNLW
jgi:hypothetical protein